MLHLMPILVDTSFLVSLTNPQEKQHRACVAVAQTIKQQLFVPVTVLPEAAYLIHSHLGHAVMRRFVQQMQQPYWQLEPIRTEDLGRSAELLQQYADSEIDFVDATILALAERLNISTVLTLDRRHFSMIRPRHTAYFTLLPE